MVMAVGLNLRD